MMQGTSSLLDGLYKVEYGVNDAFGRSIMCMHDGKLLGGNSAFAHLGTYHGQGDARLSAEVITQRHNDDPYYKPLMDTDVAAISVRGRLRRQQDSLRRQRRAGGPVPCSGPS